MGDVGQFFVFLIDWTGEGERDWKLDFQGDVYTGLGVERGLVEVVYYIGDGFDRTIPEGLGSMGSSGDN